MAQFAPSQRPVDRNGFEIAIICALPLEFDAVSLIFDEFWDDEGDIYGRAVGDVNDYTTGRIGKFNVVLALLTSMGKVNTASAAASLRSSYSRVRMALLAGICGGVPQYRDDIEILLGDVIVSDCVVQYDLCKRYVSGFRRKDTLKDNLGKLNKDLRNLLVKFQTDHGRERLQEKTALHLTKIQEKPARKNRRQRYQYPGVAEDKLFLAKYRHQHHESNISCTCQGRSGILDYFDAACDDTINSTCEDLGCDQSFLSIRERTIHKRQLNQSLVEQLQEPIIHIGTLASADTVMKSGLDRDRIASKEGVIAFEMEGAGVWEEIPCIVVKGVCDYAC